jgi:predicted PurR-regulated permease PerM
LAIVLLVGAVFFQVMAAFLVPMFLACVLLVIFQPLHRWVLDRIPGRKRIAALLTTILILLVVLLPTVWLGWKAYTECHHVYVKLQGGEADRLAAKLTNSAGKLSAVYEDITGRKLDTDALVKNGTDWIGKAVLTSVHAAISIVIGLAIMVISLYYFLADGPGMVQSLMQLSPLDPTYERELLDRFSQISRAVVVATLLSAVSQGIAAGIGYYFALPSGAPIFLLTALTMVLAIVPFIGAAGIWIPTCLWIFLYGQRMIDGQMMNDGNWPVALGLALYCGLVVSMLDNVIKPYVLHGQSNLHPLLALLSILGGVQVLGPVGILVGPMLVSFFQALLNMFQRELAQMGNMPVGKQFETPTAAMKESPKTISK